MSRTAIHRGLCAGPAGFTLVETVLATVIVGLAVVALLTAAAGGTRAGVAGQEITEAAFLARE
ncbi:MAG: hypothetical protein J7M14_01180, partial [Planctomycetes bacterium]|nr:hypothetical protein [Planctomycetota bacterium]